MTHQALESIAYCRDWQQEANGAHSKLTPIQSGIQTDFRKEMTKFRLPYYVFSPSTTRTKKTALVKTQTSELYILA